VAPARRTADRAGLRAPAAPEAPLDRSDLDGGRVPRPWRTTTGAKAIYKEELPEKKRPSEFTGLVALKPKAKADPFNHQ